MALKLVWLTLALAFLPAIAQGASGDPDGSFSGDGVAALDWGGVDDFANDVLVQPDGRIVGARERGRRRGLHRGARRVGGSGCSPDVVSVDLCAVREPRDRDPAQVA